MHFYKASDGRSLPSVTTILKATQPADQRMTLDSYYMGATSPTKFRTNDDSKRRGESIDRWAKAYLTGNRLPVVDWKFAAYQRKLQPLLDFWLYEYDSVMTDRVVFDLARGYAGTLDIALCRGGVWTVVDLKTRNFIYQPAIDEGLLQVTAYAEALRCDGHEVNSVAIVSITPKAAQTNHALSVAHLAQLSATWAARLNAYRTSQLVGAGNAN